MADPSFGALGTIYSSGSTQITSQSSTITNVGVGDLVLAFVQRDVQMDCTGVTIGGTAATLLKRNDSNSNLFSIEIWGVICTSASSSANVVATYSGIARSWGTIMSARWTPGVTAVTPIASACNATGCSGLATSSTNRLVQSITTDRRCLIIAAGTDWNDYRSHTAASGWTERADGSGTPVTSIQFIFDRVADAGTFGGATAFSTAGSDQYLSVMLAFEVAAGSGGYSLPARSPTAKYGHILVR